MFRFIFNFIFFGLLFYAIFMLFPDAFKTLVSWTDHLYNGIKELVFWVYDQVRQYGFSHKPDVTK